MNNGSEELRSMQTVAWTGALGSKSNEQVDVKNQQNPEQMTLNND